MSSKSQALKPKQIIISIRVAQINNHASLLDQLLLPHKSMKKANFQEAAQTVCHRLLVVKSKLGRGTGSHRIGVYKTEIQRFI